MGEKSGRTHPLALVGRWLLLVVIGSLDSRFVFSASRSKEVFVVKMLVSPRGDSMEEAGAGPTKCSTDSGCGIIPVIFSFDPIN